MILTKSAKASSESKYEFLIKKREDVGIKYCNDPNAFIEYSNNMDDVYKNIDDYNPNRKKKICEILTEVTTRKITKSEAKKLYSPKDVRLNSTHYLIMKIKNRKELQNIAINHSADIDYKDFVKIHSEYTNKPDPFFTIDTTLPASDPLRFRKILLPSYKNDGN